MSIVISIFTGLVISVIAIVAVVVLTVGSCFLAEAWDRAVKNDDKYLKCKIVGIIIGLLVVIGWLSRF